MLAQIGDSVMINTNDIGAIELVLKDDKWIIVMRKTDGIEKKLGSYEKENDARVAYKDMQEELQRVNGYINLVKPHIEKIPSAI